MAPPNFDPRKSVREGLRCYEAGDLQGAAKQWQESLAEAAAPEAEIYLAHLKRMASMDASLAQESMQDPIGWEPDKVAAWEDVLCFETDGSSPSQGLGLGALHLASLRMEDAHADRVQSPEASMAGQKAQSGVWHAAIQELETHMLKASSLDDFDNACVHAQEILDLDATHTQAQEVYARCSAKARAILVAKLGVRPTWVPQLRGANEDVVWLGIDHRAGFILSQVDGQASIQDIVDVSGMPELEILRILVALKEAGAIG